MWDTNDYGNSVLFTFYFCRCQFLCAFLCATENSLIQTKKKSLPNSFTDAAVCPPYTQFIAKIG